ncbi:uncharacterized protein STEHIDRAFT_103130 [Stereum hirsutum FP-91666 SS1]|uniref:uncharacterized protein n=1 Tax=Stereum hirsutum (strain FP-91666) TaxID=721885 RepID=UPI00044493AE|nr:uncharacterized protein STEHIDRAFT_103130 [Stereum hirsutum FP-91666 SS1]EIM82598.1 hypothetical protein STEHIDRAFT_103130 [Stereum hirsutum FP-91666 SS1]
MDLRVSENSPIHVVKACYADDAPDLVAIGGDNFVNVIQISETAATTIASFHVGTRITALAWSSRTISPSSSDDWLLELTAASADFGLHLLTKSHNENEDIFPFGGGLSGHHGCINDMTFCGGRTEDSARYVATVSDDKMLMVWDLHPNLDIPSVMGSPSPTRNLSPPGSSSKRAQPTAYPVPFPRALTSVNSHPSTAKELLVSDSHGSIFLIDWRSEPPDSSSTESWRHQSVVELVEPRALADATVGTSAHWSGSVSWRRDSPDIVGAAYGSRFTIWDLSKLSGGKPTATGFSFPEGSHRFRWCQTYPEYFAISTRSPSKGALLNIYNSSYAGAHSTAQPTVFTFGPRPLRVQDFDFLAMRGIPRIAAAVGRELIVFLIGVE